ncbi:MAG: hypothetical protein IKE65_06560 [Clostridia bacterium]|nr:hypothetical protein [Clostridia bacterium]
MKRYSLYRDTNKNDCEVNDMNGSYNNGAILYQLWREHQKQVIGTVAQSVHDKHSGGTPMQAENEKLRMTETKIYIGLNDSQTKEQIHPTEKYMSVLKNVCRNYNVAFSVDVEEGGYFHDDGEYTEETSFVLVLINAQKKVVDEIAKDLCTFFHQECVLVIQGHIDGYFISEKSL